MKTLEQLKAEGYEVKITHLRMADAPHGSGALLVQGHIARKLGMPISPRGGITIAEIRKPGRDWARGFSFTHPMDNFCRKIGVAKALGRAIANES